MLGGECSHNCSTPAPLDVVCGDNLKRSFTPFYFLAVTFLCVDSPRLQWLPALPSLGTQKTLDGASTPSVLTIILNSIVMNNSVVRGASRISRQTVYSKIQAAEEALIVTEVHWAEKIRSCFRTDPGKSRKYPQTSKFLV